MSEQRKKNEKNFLVQGSILAIAGVITKLIGAFYRIPLLNIIGTEGNGYYSVAFSIYSVALMLLLTASLWQYQNWYPQESP